MSMEWIKCSDRLPKDCETVLLYCCEGICYGYFHARGRIWFFRDTLLDEGEIVHGHPTEGQVSHWMPLPKRPRMEATNDQAKE